MRSLRTVILRHDRTGDSHLDWLIEHPAHPPGTGPLLAFRLPQLPGAASGGGFATPGPSPRKLLLHQLPDHRRLYLTYQGPLSNFRGHVLQVDRGRALLLRFCRDHIDLQLSLRNARWRISLRRIAINAWSAALIPVS